MPSRVRRYSGWGRFGHIVARAWLASRLGCARGAGVVLDSWALEDAFERKMHDLMRAARRQKGVVLYNYFDKAYEASVAEQCSTYIGVHELCHLTSVKACEAGAHKTCLAQQVVVAYNAVKVSSRGVTWLAAVGKRVGWRTSREGLWPSLCCFGGKRGLGMLGVLLRVRRAGLCFCTS